MPPKLCLTACSLLLYWSLAQAQAPGPVYPLRSPGSTDTTFADLQFLKPLIGGRRFVIIGEHHSEGTALNARNRLVHFLHRQMGFEVVIDEQSFYGTHRAFGLADSTGQRDDLIAAMALTYLRGRVAPADRTWLWDYAWRNRQGPRPLFYHGMDLPDPRCANLAKYLARLVAQSDSSLARDPAWLKLAGALQAAGCTWPPPPGTARALALAAGPVLPRLDRLPNPWPAQIVRNQVGWAAFRQETPQPMPGSTGAIDPAEVIRNKHRTLPPRHQVEFLPRRENMVSNRRDSLMFANVEWLAERIHPGKKVIVLCGAYHALKRTDLFADEWPMADTLRPLGWHLARHYPSQLFAVAPAAGGGHYGQVVNGTWRVTVGTIVVPNDPKQTKKNKKAALRVNRSLPPDTTTCTSMTGPVVPLPGSLEAQLALNGPAFAMVDLGPRHAWPGPTFISGVCLGKAVPKPWGALFDAILFVKATHPTVYGSLDPSWPRDKGILHDKEYMITRYNKVILPWFKWEY